MPKLEPKQINDIIKNPLTLWSGVLDNLDGGTFPSPSPPPPWAPCQGFGPFGRIGYDLTYKPQLWGATLLILDIKGHRFGMLQLGKR